MCCRNAPLWEGTSAKRVGERSFDLVGANLFVSPSVTFGERSLADAITVVAGIHHMYTLIDVGQLAKFGYTYWLPPGQRCQRSPDGRISPQNMHVWW